MIHSDEMKTHVVVNYIAKKIGFRTRLLSTYTYTYTYTYLTTTTYPPGIRCAA